MNKLPTDLVAIIAEYLPSRQDIVNISSLSQYIEIKGEKKYYTQFRIGCRTLERGDTHELLIAAKMCDNIKHLTHNRNTTQYLNDRITGIFRSNNFKIFKSLIDLIDQYYDENGRVFWHFQNALLFRLDRVSLKDFVLIEDTTPEQRSDFVKYVCRGNEYEIAMGLMSEISETKNADISDLVCKWDQVFGDDQFLTRHDIGDGIITSLHGMDISRMIDLVYDISRLGRIDLFQEFVKSRFMKHVFDISFESSHGSLLVNLLVNMCENDRNRECARVIATHPLFSFQASSIDSNHLVILQSLQK